jgi:hypothetical protein
MFEDTKEVSKKRQLIDGQAIPWQYRGQNRREKTSNNGRLNSDCSHVTIILSTEIHVDSHKDEIFSLSNMYK